MRNKILLLGLCLVILNSCSLDYENTGVINPDNVWKDKTMISGFLTDIYGNMMPGWPIAANNTDEGMDKPAGMSQYVRGQITIDNSGISFNYSNIDKINFFLDQIERTNILTEVEKNQLKGQALFWRAWDYWGKVFSLGGVPLILSPQDVTDYESLFVERSSTSDCVNQIIKDLDDAISMLPDKWEDENYGRIDKGCAMAFKGRVLLQYARPLFNVNNDSKRWENAYKANKDAIDFLNKMGKGLYEGKFEDIWYDEKNKEVIMVNQYFYPDHTFNQNSIRPEPLTQLSSNRNQAIMSLITAFPLKNGEKFEIDLQRLESDDEYNAKVLETLYTGLEPRFYATIFCPGTEYPCKDVLNDMKYWNTWSINEKGEYKTMVLDQLNLSVGGGASGFFQKKGLSRNLTKQTVNQAEVDWIEIRYAEVLMNYGECANELDKKSEAIKVLHDIRKRAGIKSDDGTYGIIAETKDEIRQAYIDERLIEFAYEGKRWNDLRSWKRYDILNSIKYRSGLYPVIKDNKLIQNFDWNKDMYDSEIRKLFKLDYIECLDGDTQYYFNLDLNHWFYPINKNDLDRNSKLKQNKEWGGDFDPLI